jgi:hypothetical protein
MLDLIPASTLSQPESSCRLRSSDHQDDLIQAWIIETGIRSVGVRVSESNPGFFHPAWLESWVISTSTPPRIFQQ